MKNFDKIKKYHEGKLSKKELDSFKKEIENKPVFKSEVEDYLQLLDGFEAIKISEFEKQLKVWAKDFSKNPEKEKVENPKISPWWKPVYLVAASISILLMGLFIWNYTSPKKQDAYSFAEKKYIPLAIDINRSKTTHLTSLQMAKEDFINKNYLKCIDELNVFYPKDSLYPFAQYLKGHAAFKAKSYDQSIQIFNNLLTNPKAKNNPKINLENAEWTMLLATYKKYLLQPSPTEKKKLLKATNSFLQRAKPSDSYFKNSEKLKKLLE